MTTNLERIYPKSQEPAAASPASGTAATDGQGMVSKDAFLKLLVAQIRNQDPLNPSDGTQFLSQLAQFSELEQLIGIREEIAALQPATTDGASKSQAAGKTQS